MKRNASKGRFIFTCIWLGIFAVAYVLWAFFLSTVTDRLEEYERTRPENKAETVFAEYFLDADPMTFSSYDDVESKYDVRGAAKEFYYSLTYGKPLAMSEHDKASGLITYSVTAGGEEFARFVLSQDESGEWTLSRIFLTAAPQNEFYVNAPKDAIVTVNGVLLDGDCAVSEYLIADSPVFGGDEQKRTMVTYRLSGLYGAPVFSVKLTAADVNLSLESESGTLFSAEKSYVAYLSYLCYGAK